MDWNSFFSTEAINRVFVHSPFFTIAIGISAVVATALYLFSFSDVVRKELKRRRMKKRIDNLNEHYILCGFGRVGQQVAKELAAEGESFVIIEKDENKLALAKERNWAYLIGDVALDESLYDKACIKDAKSAIISVGTDADAIFMAISARSMNPNIFLVARASSREAADKLSKVGVNRVALPYQIGGYHMATMALRPTIVDFLDTLVDHERDELEMEEYQVFKDGYYDGKTLEEAKLNNEKVAILALRREDGKAVINPPSSTKLQGGDRLIMMGAEKDLLVVVKEFDKRQEKEAMAAEHHTSQVVVSDIKPSHFQNEA